MSARFRIGVDLGGTKIEAVALDRSGAIRFRERCATPSDPYENTIRAIADLVAAATRATGTAVAAGTASNPSQSASPPRPTVPAARAAVANARGRRREPTSGLSGSHGAGPASENRAAQERRERR